MRIGIGAGPRNTPRHQSSHYVYDVRSGAIVGVYHFAGAAPEPAPELMAELLRSMHDSSGIPSEHLGILSGPDVPVDDGEMYVEPATKRLARRPYSDDPRIRP